MKLLYKPVSVRQNSRHDARTFPQSGPEISQNVVANLRAYLRPEFPFIGCSNRDGGFEPAPLNPNRLRGINDDDILSDLIGKPSVGAGSL